MMKKRGIRGNWLSHLGSAIFGQELLPAVGGGYRIEMTGSSHGVRAVVSGGLRILSATETEVSLTGKGLCLHFCGKDLVCLTYEGGVAEIEGRLSAFTLEEPR